MSVFGWAVRRFLAGGLVALILGAALLVCIDGFEHSRLLGAGLGLGEFFGVLLARLPLLGREVLGLFLVVGCVWVAARMRDKREWLGLSSVGVGPYGIACAATLACGGLAVLAGAALETCIVDREPFSGEVWEAESEDNWVLLDGAMVRVGQLQGNQLSNTRVFYAKGGRIEGMADGVGASFVDGSWTAVQGRYLEPGPDGELLSGPLDWVRLPAPDQLALLGGGRPLVELSLFELNRLESSRARSWWHLRLAILLAPLSWCWGLVCHVLRASSKTSWLVLLAGVQVATTQLTLVLLAAVGAPAGWIWAAFLGVVLAPSVWSAGAIRTYRRGRVFPTG